jgi:hypothetical protein
MLAELLHHSEIRDKSRKIWELVGDDLQRVGLRACSFRAARFAYFMTSTSPKTIIVANVTNSLHPLASPLSS